MKLVRQKHKLDCGVACMAMLLKCTYNEVIIYFKQDFSCQDMDESDLQCAIEQYGRKMIIHKDIDLTKDSIFIIPSLNNINKEHAVYWSDNKVYNPNNGSGLKIYTTKLFLCAKKIMQFTLE